MTKILFAIFALAFALHAEDPKPPVKEKQLTVPESVMDKAADNAIELRQAKETIAYLQRKIQMYQQGLFACQDAQIDAQAKQQHPPAPSKPESK
jgi:hypothetical protein